MKFTIGSPGAALIGSILFAIIGFDILYLYLAGYPIYYQNFSSIFLILLFFLILLKFIELLEFSLRNQKNK